MIILSFLTVFGQYLFICKMPPKRELKSNTCKMLKDEEYKILTSFSFFIEIIIYSN